MRKKKLENTLKQVHFHNENSFSVNMSAEHSFKDLRLGKKLLMIDNKLIIDDRKTLLQH